MLTVASSNCKGQHMYMARPKVQEVLFIKWKENQLIAAKHKHLSISTQPPQKSKPYWFQQIFKKYISTKNNMFYTLTEIQIYHFLFPEHLFSMRPTSQSHCNKTSLFTCLRKCTTTQLSFLGHKKLQTS